MRSRLRKLYAHDRQFAWNARIDQVRTGQGLCRCIRLRIWGAGKNSRALRVDLLSRATRSRWGDPAATDGAYPESKDVRAVIDYALGNGWRPDDLGGTFVLSEARHAQELLLPAFVVTDLLRLAERPTSTRQPAPS
ncbi:integrase [Plantactinospora sp. S1510]|uniref:Integrase n=1 Tax=Plantactinospora alkalitolerans TaxID=2789879 RepID=A0ABS0H7Q7_9ACTN|nr:integrase [Plantactinospora alkalitolerans]MBF9134490.1 integrase [Plantactinospora alkalitolerans]